MKIAILGTRGIPNYYGGFEQFAEYLSLGLEKKGHSVWVYNSHNHPISEKCWKGINRILCYDPEYKYGTAGQFIYDLNCILDSRKRKFDLILQLGYTSSSIWGPLLPTASVIATNMDGLEWKRTKYSRPVQIFLKLAERLGVYFSDFLISDSLGIQSYIQSSYNKNSAYIPYGAEIPEKYDINTPGKYALTPGKYSLLIARLEPENSIEIILKGFIKSQIKTPLIIIGNHQTEYGKYIQKTYPDKNIIFLGSLFDIQILNDLRYYSQYYFHGHTVGGTNPSLLEAMASSAYICANNNMFNAGILGEDALYFNTYDEVATILNTKIQETHRSQCIQNNLQKIKQIYSWDHIINQYENFLEDCISRKSGTVKNHNSY